MSCKFSRIYKEFHGTHKCSLKTTVCKMWVAKFVKLIQDKKEYVQLSQERCDSINETSKKEIVHNTQFWEMQFT